MRSSVARVLSADDVLDAVLWERARQGTQPLEQVALHVLEHEAELLPLVHDFSQLHHMRVRRHGQQRLHLALAHGIVEGWEGAFEVFDGDGRVGRQVARRHDGAERAIADDALDAVVLHEGRTEVLQG